jgi:pyrroline-5-carboxylate reductase
MSDVSRIGIVGGSGWLGGAIVKSILDARLVSPEDFTLSYRREPPKRFPGVRWTADNQELVDRSDVIIISVRPEDWPALAFDARDKFVISVMAGIGLSQLAAQLRTLRVVRALPNAAAEVGQSYTPWVASADVDDQDRSLAQRIFDACGTSDEVANEGDMDYFVGLSGAGPAFPALLATAMMDDALARGLRPDMARRAVNAVLIGAGRLLEHHDECPADTVETFTSYRGTTAAAIGAMREAGFEAAVRSGLAEALRKSKDMGRRS